MTEKLKKKRFLNQEHDQCITTNIKIDPVIHQSVSHTSRVVQHMQKCLDRLGIPLKVIWTPSLEQKIHGEITNGYIRIYDVKKDAAWNTFTHEVVEFRHKDVTRPYVILVNQLIEFCQKITYHEKEEFIDSLPKVYQTIEDERCQSDEESDEKQNQESNKKL